MPRVGKKKFAYSAAGKKKAKAYAMKFKKKLAKKEVPVRAATIRKWERKMAAKLLKDTLEKKKPAKKTGKKKVKRKKKSSGGYA